MANETQLKTFLSYSRANKDFAIRLAKELKSEGFSVWLDQLDIPAGSRWDREVEKALKECEIFMIILTSASVDSENVLDEIGYAIDTGKRFLPVLLEKCDVPFRLRRFQYVDFTNKNFDDGVESAKDLLRNLIAQTTTSQRTQPESQGQTTQPDTGQVATQKAEEERLAQVKADTERKAKEEADRLAAQKAESDRVAKQKVEEERLAQVKAKEEADRIAKAEAKGKTKDKSTPAKKRPVLKGIVIGIVVIVLCAIVGIGFNILSNRNTPTPDVEGGVIHYDLDCYDMNVSNEDRKTVPLYSGATVVVSLQHCESGTYKSTGSITPNSSIDSYLTNVSEFKITGNAYLEIHGNKIFKWTFAATP
ncbi:MAG: TIR domain-containing protein [Anaerolineales bacterium]|nr:TIR domain-containing protein [Anaerolineales bacterium]